MSSCLHGECRRVYMANQWFVFLNLFSYMICECEVWNVVVFTWRVRDSCFETLIHVYTFIVIYDMWRWNVLAFTLRVKGFGWATRIANTRFLNLVFLNLSLFKCVEWVCSSVLSELQRVAVWCSVSNTRFLNLVFLNLFSYMIVGCEIHSHTHCESKGFVYKYLCMRHMGWLH